MKYSIQLFFILIFFSCSVQRKEPISIGPEMMNFLNDTTEMKELNKNYQLRDSILNRKINWNLHENDIVRINTITFEQLTHLLQERFADPNEYQNESPTIGEFYRFMSKYPDVKAHGYIVSPFRDDYRVSIEGLEVEEKYVDWTLKSDFLELCANADELTVEEGLYSWWD